MKKIILTLILFGTLFLLTAQNTDFRSQMNAIFENVDLSQVPSGILSDYSLSLVDDSLYNGQILSDNILSSIQKDELNEKAYIIVVVC